MFEGGFAINHNAEEEEIQFCKILRYSTKIDKLEKRRESEYNND